MTDRGFTEIRFSGIHGRGLFAKKKIPKGTRLPEYEGKRVERNQIVNDAINGPTNMMYVMGLNETMVIDGERDGNDARFMNHHCNPNCEVYFMYLMNPQTAGIREVTNAEYNKLTYSKITLENRIYTVKERTIKLDAAKLSL